ncbi:DNA methylase [Trabulsiella odontotermitis]|uniref:DNA methylase n=1 Tax=Trabulsiella odontotermitis TaxID=379893 RepID=UPI000676298B|nr:DNA methylase [Trabulsiella odontotermitis]KNC89846.1 DNA methylase [Trabulsiella odontotermitis]
MSYLGSKAASGVYQKIIAEMPPHDLYIETHLGGGTIMRNKPPAMHNIGIDIDQQTLDEFEMPKWLSSGFCSLELIRQDAVDFLEGFNFRELSAGRRVLLYVDPPYLPETRTSKARYRHEYTVEDHERLLSCLLAMPYNVSVIISGYPSKVYDELLAGWRTKEFQAMTRGGVRTEKIWMNYPSDCAYSHAFAGKDYNDRHRIKRKAERWRKKYAALPSAERLAIMVALNEVDGGDHV